MKYFLGIEIGSGKIHLAVADETYTITEHIRRDVVPGNTAEDLRAQIEEVIDDLQTRYRFSSMCVGFGGPVDWRQGKTIQSYRIEGWKNFDLSDWLEDHLHCPSWVENDANLAALAEAIQGAGKNYATVFYLKLGHGIGGGLIQKGQIYHGARPGESEIGKIRLDRSGTTLESVASVRAIIQRIEEEVAKQPDGPLAQAVAAGQGVSYLIQALANGDVLAEQLLNETADQLAFALSHVVHLFHPDLIVLSGGVPELTEKLSQVIDQKLSAYVMEAFLPLPKIALAQLQDEAVVRGALLVARQNSYL